MLILSESTVELLAEMGDVTADNILFEAYEIDPNTQMDFVWYEDCFYAMKFIKEEAA